MKQVRLLGQSAEFLRFAIVAVAGLVMDILLAWGLSSVFGLNLVFAAAAGFVVGAAFNYMLHEFWTFRRADCQLSTRRMLLYCGALGVTLATRLTVVYWLSQILNAVRDDLAILLLATVMSFGVNYLVSKFFVFRSTPRNQRPPTKGTHDS
ncbi:GtrA family protein [Thalassospira sp. MCCC 1A01428]|uniref:GtrA family protein n=1 Tax=Thalassospira sp. MCCC 1A01428 TaxID=1470575 RepID=UPI000A1F243F|nr:GtrA family protein [Thalassospira sp. MCCC 1A01428]OSQ34514.1 hypothetical protein THS27_25300 [Thalassospira sp. MCCC 1A01428]